MLQSASMYFCAAMRITLSIVFFIALSLKSFGQIDEKSKSVTVSYITEKPKIDGVLDENFWDKVLPAKDFWQYFPTDTLRAIARTEVYFASDENNLYVGIKCYSIGNKFIVNSLKRDFRAMGNDNVTLVFDTFNDKTNGIFFGTNPEGVLREGVVTNGGNNFGDFSESWDNKWKGEAKNFDGYYTAEFEIPFSTLRYTAGGTKWGLLIYRFDTQTNENMVWNRIPRNQTLFSLAYTGEMLWEKPLSKSSSTVSLIPFVSSAVTKNFEENNPAKKNIDVGGDAKIAINSGLNLDLTINPDFSQVEVDQQVTNLDRFEIFFPERRQFFVENADLFGDFGFSNINPFFSRRIGVAVDTSTEVNTQNRILAGARISGKLDNKTRVGLLNMQTAENVSKGLPSINYSVAALQRKVLDRSNLGLIMVNKHTFGDNLDLLGLDKYNRVVGADFNYASSDNTYSGKTFVHKSFSPNSSGIQMSHGTRFNYSTRPLGIEWRHEFVSDNYNAEVGFIRRTNYWRMNPEVQFRFYPQNDFINDYAIGISSEVFLRPEFGRTDQTNSLRLSGSLSNTTRFSFGLNHEYVYLFDSFDPTGTDSEVLPANTSYNYINFEGFYFGDRRKDIAWSFRPYVGSYFNGFRAGLGGSINFRFQPKGNIELNYSYNMFDMPHIAEVKHTFLIGPRIDYTFSKSLFFTTFIQYNSQSENTNINARLQWRFAPVSDFYLVYTDNYFTGTDPFDPSDRFGFNIKNRAIVAKLTYWLNI